MKTKASVLSVLFILCLCLSGALCPSSATWLEGGNPVCAAAGYQRYHQIASDGFGGAIIAWYDGRTAWDSYVQRIRADGSPAWAVNGVCVSNVPTDHASPQPLSDGAGGAIVVWQDYRSGKWDIYAQRIRADGTVAWASGGLPVCAVPGTHAGPRAVCDGAGGAVVAWEDTRNGNYDIYAQRISANGTLTWAAGGVVICVAAGNQRSLRMTADGAGGAIMTWEDYRTYLDVYAQRVSAGGTPMWTADGVAVCVAARNQYYPRIAPDGAGGAIITWQDDRTTAYDIYAQRIEAGGMPAWVVDGVLICGAIGHQSHPQIASDGAGGAVIAWDEIRGGLGYDIFARRVSAGGTPMWAVDGVRICAARYDQASPEIVPDGAGGAIVTWPDWRSGNVDIYARRVNADGTPMWNADGVRLSTSPSSEDSPLIVADGCGGAVVAWVEWHQDTAYDIYAQRVDANGAGGPTPVVFAEASARMENGCVSLSWQVAADVPASSFVVRRADAPDGMFGPVEVSVVRVAGSSFSCLDCSVQSGRTYWYEIILAGLSGEESSGPVEVRVDSAPVAFRAYGSYPNPFNPVCTVRYEVPSACNVSLKVFDVSGSVVRVLVDGWREPGVYSEVWDGRGGDGRGLPSGVYLYSFQAREFTATHKMILLR